MSYGEELALHDGRGMPRHPRKTYRGHPVPN